MKAYRVAATILALVHFAEAGESAFTTTYQPLDGLGSGQIRIVQVTCHHWFSGSASSPVDLIDVPNIPPTDNPAEAKENLNLASACGVAISTSDLGDPQAPLEITIDLIRLSVPERFGYPREDIVRACLECLRRAMPDKLLGTPVTLKAAEADLPWADPIVKEFNEHDRKNVFFHPRRIKPPPCPPAN